ncbi:MAG: hypothetical protein WB992_07765 [Bryobacteraceae bacterium]
MNIVSRIASIAVLAFWLVPPNRQLAGYSTSQNSSKQSSTTAGAKKSSARSAPSSEEIADAKAKGLVWVNLSTHVYHKGGQMYGNTKRGKFMAEEDAKKAGYRMAKDNESSKQASTPSNPK